MPLLSWHDRDSDLTRAARAPYRLLEPMDELSCGDRDSPNMLIEGDNLDALKALLPYYAGQVKCIFIDPPYNTRSAFEHYDDNLEHSQWLSMMYPRLELLREFLRQDGSLWITLDDNEAHYLKVVCDEILGRKNFVANVIWRKNYSPKSSARQFSVDHDHLLVYARNGVTWLPNLVARTGAQDLAYKNRDGDPRGPWKSSDLSARNSYSLGIYPIVTPSGRKIDGPPSGRYWSISKAKLDELDRDGRIWWGVDGSSAPSLKRFLSDVKQGRVPQTYWHFDEAGHTQDAKKEIVAIFGEKVFATPKPEKLVERILQIATQPGDLVLDSFLGSGTTAAVAHKTGRRWIGIEIGEHARTHCQPRLRKVVEGEGGGISESAGWQGGGGFRYYRLGNSIFDANGHVQAGIQFEHLAAHVWFADTGKARSAAAGNEPFLGAHNGVGYYLLFNGVLGGRGQADSNVLNRRVLRALPAFDGPKVIYAEACALSQEQLRDLDIDFRQTPYDIKAR